MGYRSLRECVDDLERAGQLVRISEQIDPHLEAAEIQRRLYAAGGPAVLFERVKGTSFPMVCNLFGTLARAKFLFRDTLRRVRLMIQAKIDPPSVVGRPGSWWSLLRAGLSTLPKPVGDGPVFFGKTTLSQLPQLQSWPDDGGPFITLPLVYTEDPDQPGWSGSNLGMYRVQLGGNQYEPDQEVGLHYQIHRGIGVHHAKAIRRGEPLRVNVFVGGPPAMTLAAVMPLPEGLSELIFAGALGGRRVRLKRSDRGPAIWADADFCLSGWIDLNLQKPEGPFGDHLGYYSLQHPFPVMRVEQVYHRSGAIWPFTVVGRPPQEDTVFGELIHELTGPIIPTVIPGVQAVHAVDAAGVHPLLLAIGSERYTPYAQPKRPQELLTQANAILGQGQLSLAKYLLIVAQEDQPELDIHDIPAFFQHWLKRADWSRDLHFQTCTTIDTLDYSGGAINEGSKLVAAASGPPIRELTCEIPPELHLPEGFGNPRLCLPGILAVEGPKYSTAADRSVDRSVEEFCQALTVDAPLCRFPLVVLVDDSEFAARTLQNFLWLTFTRSDPASDVHGIECFISRKHWGCRGSLVIDARHKPHHAPPLVEDPAVTRRINQLATRGGPLHGLF